MPLAQQYDHMEFPGIVPRTFIVRLALGFFILATLHFLRVQIKKIGLQVEAFFVILIAIQFHMLFYCTRPLPNILALGLVNLSYGYWFKGSFYATLRCLVNKLESMLEREVREREEIQARLDSEVKLREEMENHLLGKMSDLLKQ